MAFDLNNGKLTMKKGSINIANNFIVDEEGNLTARRGTFAGTLSAAKGTFGGQLVAASGDFKGIVQASDFLDRNGNSMMNGSKFSSDYLDLYGLTIRNKYTNAITFQVDYSGNVTINGTVTMGAGSSINWATVGNINLDNNPAYRLADSALDKANDVQYQLNRLDIPTVPDYIRSTYIDSVEIKSPTITGNEIIARQYFTVAPSRYSIYGYMGMAYGEDANGNLTYGVALSHDTPDRLSRSGCYVIVTNAGVRMQAPGHSLTVTSTGCWADGNKIGSGTAVWG